MKMKIEWYENCLKNQISSVERLREEVKRIEIGIKESDDRIAFRRIHIAEAKRQGKDGFDADKFLVKRNVKEV